MNTLLQSVMENLVFVLQFLGLVLLAFLIAYGIEKAVKKKNGDTERVLTTRKIVVIGIFSAMSGVLMSLSFPVPFAPSFYDIGLRLWAGGRGDDRIFKDPGQAGA